MAKSMRLAKDLWRLLGFKAEGKAASITRGVPTVGRISNGAIIEREIKHTLGKQNSLRLALRNPDLTTARRIAMGINAFTGGSMAKAIDPSTVRLHLNPKDSAQFDFPADRDRTDLCRA